MSTKALPGFPSLRLASFGLLCAALAACAETPSDTSRRPFAELRLGGTPAMSPPAYPAGPEPPVVPAAARAQAEPPRLRPPLGPPQVATPTLPVTLAVALQRVTGWLGHQGFAVEGRSEGTGERLTATRMGAPSALQGDAVCGLQAMHRPDVSSTDLTIRFAPAPGGVRVQAEARFVEIDTRILSGDLSRQTCRTRGRLEAAVIQAALGG